MCIRPHSEDSGSLCVYAHRSAPVVFPLIFLRQSHSLSLELTNSTRLATNPVGVTCLLPFLPSSASSAVPSLYMGTGNQTQVFALVWQHFTDWTISPAPNNVKPHLRLCWYWVIERWAGIANRQEILRETKGQRGSRQRGLSHQHHGGLQSLTPGRKLLARAYLDQDTLHRSIQQVNLTWYSCEFCFLMLVFVKSVLVPVSWALPLDEISNWCPPLPLWVILR